MAPAEPSKSCETSLAGMRHSTASFVPPVAPEHDFSGDTFGKKKQWKFPFPDFSLVNLGEREKNKKRNTYWLLTRTVQVAVDSQKVFGFCFFFSSFSLTICIFLNFTLHSFNTVLLGPLFSAKNCLRMLKERLSLHHFLQTRRKHHKECFQKLSLLQDFQAGVRFFGRSSSCSKSK